MEKSSAESVTAEKIAAVIVTYNRREKLRHCIEVVLRQDTADVPDIIVVDNNSSDGTESVIEELSCQAPGRITCCRLPENIGGAGGFSCGVRKAVEAGYDILWLMDDDCIPAPDSLDQLLRFGRSQDGNYGFLTSKVLWRDGSPCRMNVPRRTAFKNIGIRALGKLTEPCSVSMASFVSLLVPARIVKDVGLPIKDFYIWTDDWEYTRRISRRYPCWLVPASEVIHDCDSNSPADIAGADGERVQRFRYLYRNDVFLYRREGVKGLAYEAARLSLHSARIAFSKNSLREKLRREGIMLSATAKGLRFRPETERVGSDAVRILEAFGEPLSYGGQESFVMNMIDHMDTASLVFDMLTPYYCDNAEISSRIRASGGSLHALGCSFRPGRSRADTIAPIRRFLRENHYDIIHIHSGSSSMLAICSWLAHDAGIKRIIVHSHSTGLDGPVHRAAKLATTGALRKYPTDWLACSEAAGLWRFPADICRDSLRIVRNGIDADRFAYDGAVRTRTRKDLGIADDAVVIGMVGRLSAVKNHSFMIDLLGDILRENDREAAEQEKKEREMVSGGRYMLLIAGDGELSARLREAAEAAGIADAVIFTGAMQNISDIYQALDLLVMPSLYEGFPIAAVEAQASGLEVCAADTVTVEADLSGLVRFLPLGDRAAWIDAITSKHRRHTGAAELIKNAGYDAHESAALLRDIYCRQQLPQETY